MRVYVCVCMCVCVCERERERERERECVYMNICVCVCVYTSGIRKKKYTNVSQQLEIVCGNGRGMEKDYLMRESKIAIWLFCSWHDSRHVFLVQRIEKKSRMGFCYCRVTPHETSNRHAHSLRGTINYCLYTNTNIWKCLKY